MGKAFLGALLAESRGGGRGRPSGTLDAGSSRGPPTELGLQREGALAPGLGRDAPCAPALSWGSSGLIPMLMVLPGNH